ncbi:hypothetical protein ABPG74_006751 [Tetrahymena malaccensis]
MPTKKLSNKQDFTCIDHQKQLSQLLINKIKNKLIKNQNINFDKHILKINQSLNKNKFQLLGGSSDDNNLEEITKKLCEKVQEQKQRQLQKQKDQFNIDSNNEDHYNFYYNDFQRNQSQESKKQSSCYSKSEEVKYSYDYKSNIDDNLQDEQKSQNNNDQDPKKKLSEQDKIFIESIIKLDTYINSGGQADIYSSLDQNFVFKIQKIRNNKIQNQVEIINNNNQISEKLALNLDISHIIQNKRTNQIYIVHIMQKCQMSLSEYLIQNKNIDLSTGLEIIFTIFDILISLRQKYIYHQDIKPDNILVSNDEFKLSDFGGSKKILFSQIYQTSDLHTPGYRQDKAMSQQPFYHDLYSAIQTIIEVLDQIKAENIQGTELIKMLKEQINKLKNSIDNQQEIEQIDCFQLPGQFINYIMNQKDEKVRKQVDKFFEKYLKNIEKYIKIDKKNKIFNYESELQYAEIALKINLEPTKSWQTNQIKLKALLTKCYISYKNQEYNNSIDFIGQALEYLKEESRKDQQLEIIRDSDTWKLYLIYLDINKTNFLEKSQPINEKIQILLNEYEKIIPITQNITYQGELVYKEQIEFQKLQQKHFQKQQELKNSINSQNNQNTDINNQKFFEEQNKQIIDQINKSMKDIKKQKFQIKQQHYQIIKYFDSSSLKLEFVGTQQKFCEKVNQFASYMDCQTLIKQNLLNDRNSKVQILIIKVCQSQPSDLIVQQQDQTSFIIQLNQQKINYQDAKAIVDAIKNSEQIEEINLNLSKNNFSDEQAQIILSNFQNYQYLTRLVLNLRENKIGDEGAKNIASALERSLIRFEKLNLNLIQKALKLKIEEKSIQQVLQRFKSVTELTLDFSQSEIGAKEINQMLITKEHIQGKNKIDPDVAQSIKKTLENLISIDKKYVNFENENKINKIEGVAQKNFSIDMKKLSIIIVQKSIKHLEEQNNFRLKVYFSKDNSESSNNSDGEHVQNIFLQPLCDSVGSKESLNILKILEKCTFINKLGLDLSKNSIDFQQTFTSIQITLKNCKDLEEMYLKLEQITYQMFQ